MSKIGVRQISISDPIKAVGKMFTGDYGQASKYIQEVQAALENKAIKWIPNKVMGIYYDNPYLTKAADLRSFQAVFIEPGQSFENDAVLSFVELKGLCLYTRVSGDPVKSIAGGYNAMFEYLNENKLVPKSWAAYQISVFENNTIHTEIYMELP